MTNDFLDNLGAIQYQKMHEKPKRDEKEKGEKEVMKDDR
tara:strand:- start:591 stop:707 length:117 start_codon:yes stop_codon:yes gene_type:complete